MQIRQKLSCRVEGVPRNVKIINSYQLKDKVTINKAGIKWVGCSNRVALVAKWFELITQIAISHEQNYHRTQIMSILADKNIHYLLFFSIIHTYVYLQETPTEKAILELCSSENYFIGRPRHE